ncbi:A-kinase anchor protein 8-like isoform X2 [Xenopus laevis]|uniref:A-kinase anchor protein 8-like isoform X2 n=2 Tax=Xenopus laevis TaxID=8355 RepID=A0A1L8H2F9_XENLA|nr:A-kinase anchor protein 8-like isoform X2 [Xenopus laevis]OCT90278.1 hypothetical protein XELAEV_18018890mg [Xenopus laevis]
MDPGYYAFGSWGAVSNQQGSVTQTSVRWEGYNIPQLPLYSSNWSASLSSAGPQYKSFETHSDDSQAAHRNPTTLAWPSEGSNSNWLRHQESQSQGTPAIEWKGFTEDPNVTSSANTSTWVPKRIRRKKRNKLLKLHKKFSAEVKASANASSTQGGRSVSHKDREDNHNEIREKPTSQNGTAPKISADRGEKPPKKKKLKSEKQKESKKIVPVLKAPAKDAKSEAGSKEFSCCFCRYQTENQREIEQHFRTSTHLEVIKRLHSALPRSKMDFIQEYLDFDVKRVASEQKLPVTRPDYFKGFGQQHFMQRVQAIRCSACDVLLPDVREVIKEHTVSQLHSLNRRRMFCKLKDDCVIRARKFFSDKNTSALLDSYIKGKNPFAEATHKDKYKRHKETSANQVSRADTPEKDVQSNDGGDCQAEPPAQLQDDEEEKREENLLDLCTVSDEDGGEDQNDEVAA